MQEGAEMKGAAAFKKWFGASKVRDTDTTPLTVYHGTTHDFGVFTIERGNIENYWGAGFYFTSDPDDASRNYAGEGPDLTNRLERIAEQLADQLDEEENPEGTLEKRRELNERAMEEARKRLKGSHEGAVIPVYLKIAKPLVLGVGGAGTTYVDGLRETWWSPKQSRKFAELVLDIGRGFEDVDGEYRGDVYEFTEYEDRRAEDVIETVKHDFALATATDERGDLASTEIIRRAVAMMGYDGIIDRAVMKRFQNMGLNYETIHFIVWTPEQVKSVFNRGTWSKADPHISNAPRARAERCGGRLVRYGAKGATVAPGTPKGDAYCARSLGQMRDHPGAANDPCSPLRLSRKRWACKGGKSMKTNPSVPVSVPRPMSPKALAKYLALQRAAKSKQSTLLCEVKENPPPEQVEANRIAELLTYSPL
jgi:hypothetical protein